MKRCLASGIFTALLSGLALAPSTGIEPVAYRLGGGRSIRLSYEGEGGALCGALLPVTVFLAVKVTGGPGLASWDRALVGVWLCRVTPSRDVILIAVETPGQQGVASFRGPPLALRSGSGR